MFDLWPGYTAHMDCSQYNKKDFIFMMDWLTGFIYCEKTPNEATSSAILYVRNWANKYGFPYKIISDGSGGFWDDSKKQLN